MMENGVQVVVDGEGSAVVEETMESDSEKMENRSLGGSHKSVDSEGDDAFEEAIGGDAEDHVQVKSDDSDDVVLALNDGQVIQAEKDPDLEPPREVDAFLEAIGVSEVVAVAEPGVEQPVNEESNLQVGRESNVEVSASAVATNPVVKVVAVDEVASRMEPAAVESNVSVGNDLVCHGGEAGKDMVNSVGDVMEVGDKTPAEKSDNWYSDDVNLKGGSVFEKSENSNAAEVSEVAVSVSLDAKSYGNAMIQEGTGEMFNRQMSGPITELQDDRTSKQENIEQHVHKDDRIQDVGGLSTDSPTGSSGLESSTSANDSVIVKDEAFKAQTSDLGDWDIKSPQALSASGNINGNCDDLDAIDEAIGDSTEDEVKKETDEVRIEQEIEPVADAASSSTKPANLPSSARPAGLGRAAPLLEPAPRTVKQSQASTSISEMPSQLTEGPANGEAEGTDETREKLQILRVKFLRLARRLGQTPHNVVVAQVLYRLGLAEQLRGRNGSRSGAFSFDRASAVAERLEAAGQEQLDFSLTIMVLGKTGVGKSATINSILDEAKFSTDAFGVGTKMVQDVIGTVQGIKVRVIDTPGLLPFWRDQRQNEKILRSVKNFIKKSPPDIVLYVDRLDMQTREFGDMPLLRTVTEVFGPSLWFNAIVVLTHAGSAPPDGPNGVASTYDMFVTQRSHLVQQAIRQAAGDMRLMNPVSLVENHLACRTNRAGQRVLPNGQIWKPHLLLLSFASKILAEANAVLKLQDTLPGKPFAARSRPPPLPFLLSSLIQSRPQPKLPEEQLGDEETLDNDFQESSDSDDELEYDELPPFKSLTKLQVEKLTKEQRKAYFDELEYREKIFMKKQIKDEKKRRKMMKEMAGSAQVPEGDHTTDAAEEQSEGPATVPVPMADISLPASFDSDNPTHRYRFIDSPNQWLVRPVLETHGWDHDVGYEGINVERVFVVKDKIPLSFSGQVTKDKKDTNLQVEVASSVKHGKGKSTSLGFDMQTVGKDMIYTVRGETMLSNHKRNKATTGVSVTLAGDALSTGIKLEDKLTVSKRLQFVVTGGAMTGRGDVAYGGSVEATLRDRDYPLGRSLSTFGLSIMDWHGDLAMGCNVQSQVPVGRSTNLIARANLNNRGTGQVIIRLNSSEHWQIILVGLIPLVGKLRSHPLVEMLRSHLHMDNNEND